MKKVLFAFLLFLSNSLLADGLDQVKIYKNGQLIETTYEFIEKKLSVQVGDTLLFSVWTDWGGTLAGELDLFNTKDSSMFTILRSINNSYEAKFRIILTQKMINVPIEFTYHFKDSATDDDIIKPWRFAIIEFN